MHDAASTCICLTGPGPDSCRYLETRLTLDRLRSYGSPALQNVVVKAVVAVMPDLRDPYSFPEGFLLLDRALSMKSDAACYEQLTGGAQLFGAGHPNGVTYDDVARMQVMYILTGAQGLAHGTAAQNDG